MQLPLNAMRAFEAAARHLSFTRAALELHVTQNAVSAQVKNLESRLGTPLFRRLPRGLALTDEGQALLPLLRDSFERMHAVLEQFEGGLHRQVVTVAVVGTFAVGWLLPRLPAFQRDHPAIALRLLTNNNRVDLAAEGLDWAIRFGDGAWHGTEAQALIAPPLSPVCAPAIARRLRVPADLAREPLLRSYRADEWARWFAAARIGAAAAARADLRLVDHDGRGRRPGRRRRAAAAGAVRRRTAQRTPRAAVPHRRDAGRLLAHAPESRAETEAMRTFADWLQTVPGRGRAPGDAACARRVTTGDRQAHAHHVHQQAGGRGRQREAQRIGVGRQRQHDEVHEAVDRHADRPGLPRSAPRAARPSGARRPGTAPPATITIAVVQRQPERRPQASRPS